MNPVIDRLELEHGKPLLEILLPYAKRGYSRTEAGEMLGVHMQTLRHAEIRMGLEVVWPGKNQGKRRKEAYQQLGDKIRTMKLRHPNTILIHEPDGKVLSLKAAAERRGLAQRTVWDRWKAGIRPPELWRRPHKTMGKPPDTYRLGMSLRDWDTVLEYAEHRGTGAASRKFGIPAGAIKSVMCGDWWRVA